MTTGGTGSAKPTLADVARRHAELIALLGAGSVFGEIGERVAASVTGSVRISGTGNDLRRPAPQGWIRPAPVAVIGDSNGAKVVPTETVLRDSRTRARYQRWVATDEFQLGEVKTRQLDRCYMDAVQLVDTRGGGATTAFCPLVDFYVFVIFDPSGTLRKCLEVPLPVLADYVASNVGRGGSWNYKVAIGLWTDVGIDRTDDAISALRTLNAAPESKRREYE